MFKNRPGMSLLPAALTVVLSLSCRPDLVEVDSERSLPGEGAQTSVVGGRASAVVFVNGNVLTMAPVTRVDEAIAIRGSRIVRTGSTEAMLRWAGPRATVIDLEGRTLMPGFVDAHSHYLLGSSPEVGQDRDNFQRIAIRFGTTTVGELNVSEQALPDLLAWADAGNLRLRANLHLAALTDVCGNPVDDWWKAHRPSRRPTDLLWIAGVKAFADGGACNQPAESVEFAPGAGFGDLYLDADEVADLVTDADRYGFQVAIHALGDRAVDVALDGFAQSRRGRRVRGLRHRIEHSFVTRDDQLPRYSELGVVPVVFGYSFSGHLEHEFLGGIMGCAAAPRNDFYQQSEGQLRKLLDANPKHPVAWSNDNPPWPPLRNTADLHNMVTRQQVYGGPDGSPVFCDPPAWRAATAVTVEEALTMMTVNAAHALGRERLVGSLEPGKFADIIILSDNPLTVPPEDLFHLEVWMTMIGGEVEFCAEGREALCPGITD